MYHKLKYQAFSINSFLIANLQKISLELWLARFITIFL